ncbi:8600_t:CDS:2, partial [Funneliformis geosporum]
RNSGICTKDARNENSDPFQRALSGGITSLGISSSSRCRHVDDNQRKSLVVYGWLQVDTLFRDLYKFGLIDHCILPSQEDDCGLFEDIYCILKEVNIKLLQTEKSVKNLYRNNMLGKRRRTTMKNSPVLNTNRSPN